MYWRAACRDDAFLEADDLLLAGFVLSLAVGQFDFDVVRVEEGAVAAHDIDLAGLGHAGEAGGQFFDHFGFVGAQLVEIDLWRGEGDTGLSHVRRFFHHRGDMQQGFRGNAPDVEAHAAERGIAFDDDRLHAQIGGAESGRIAARAGAENEHFALDVGLAGELPRLRSARWRGGRRTDRCVRLADRWSRSRTRGRGGGRRFRRRGGCGGHGCTGFDAGDDAALRYLVAGLDGDFLDDAVAGARNVDGCLVRLERHQRFFRGHRIADLHGDFDDRNVLEIPDVGDFDFNDLAHSVSPDQTSARRMSASNCAT